MGKDKKAKNEVQYAAPALEKGLEILELLSNRQVAMGQSGIAQSLGRSSNEIFRMLAVLEKQGYLHRNATTGEYMLSLKLFTLGRYVQPLLSLVSAAREPMRAFSEVNGQECHLCVIEEGRLVVLHAQRASSPVGIFVDSGSVHNPMTTASGRLLLAQMPESELVRQLALAAAAFTCTDLVDECAEAIRALSATHQTEAQDETLRGLSDMSVLIQANDPSFNVTLATTYFSSSIDRASRVKLRSGLLASAEKIHKHI